MPIKANSCALWIHILSNLCILRVKVIFHYFIVQSCFLRIFQQYIRILQANHSSCSSIQVALVDDFAWCYQLQPICSSRNIWIEMLLCNALLLEQKPRTLGNYEIPKTTLRLPFESVQNRMRRASEIAMYIKIQIYILISHFLISNIITNIFFCSYHLHYERFKRALSVFFF